MVYGVRQYGVQQYTSTAVRRTAELQYGSTAYGSTAFPGLICVCLIVWIRFSADKFLVSAPLGTGPIAELRPELFMLCYVYVMLCLLLFLIDGLDHVPR